MVTKTKSSKSKKLSKSETKSNKVSKKTVI